MADWKHMGEDAWVAHPDHYFALEGRTLSACMDEVRAILNGQYMRYEHGTTSEPGRSRFDPDQLRDRAQRLVALLEKAEGPVGE